MKAFWMLLALSVCATVFAQGPRNTVRDFRSRGANSAPCGCWYKTPDGRWLWVEGSYVMPNGQRALRTYSYYRPPTTLYSDDGRPQVIGGIDWYLNGRGPFSD